MTTPLSFGSIARVDRESHCGLCQCILFRLEIAMAARKRSKPRSDFAKVSRPHPLGLWFEKFSSAATRWTGSSMALGLAFGLILGWLLTGPMFKYSDSWQLIINTSTTIITFLMVFLIQRAQNKEALSVQLKLNEAIAALKGASNRLISVEDLTEDGLEVLRTHYQELAQLAKNESDIKATHSVEDAQTRHAAKRHMKS